jgi:hypothetical protein
VSSDLVARAAEWVEDVHPHARHLHRTLDWLLELDPRASEALRLAAVAHDIERAFPAEDAPPSSDEGPIAAAYERWHQDRSAEVLAGWLRKQAAPAALVDEVSSLVRVHEDGGSADADLLQAADSLSFLEVQVELFAGLVAAGTLTREQAERKLERMYGRISVPRARELAEPMLSRGLARLGDADA